MTRGPFGLAHAPLLLIKAYEHLCVCLCLPCTFDRLVTRGPFGLAHAPLLLIKAYEHFVREFCVFLVRSTSCHEGAFRRAHAPLLLIKPYGHSCLCYRPLVRSCCVLILLVPVWSLGLCGDLERSTSRDQREPPASQNKGATRPCSGRGREVVLS